MKKACPPSPILVAVMPTTPALVPMRRAPSLWPALDPARQRQLAQCLAELLRRLNRLARSAGAEDAGSVPDMDFIPKPQIHIG
jgi:hypothetical protein